MKKKLLELLAKKEARKQELFTKTQSTEDVAELRSINTELETLNGEIAELRSMVDALPDDTPAPAAPTPDNNTPPAQPVQQRSTPQGQLNVLGTYGVPGAQPPSDPEKRDFSVMNRDELLKTPEYRSAYLKTLQRKSITDLEQRALTTAAGSGGAAVPTATYDMIIERLRQTSVLFPLISATYFPGNVTLPVADPATAAAWSDEATEGDVGDDTVQGVTLLGYTLAKYAKISAAAMAMTIDAFEAYIVKQIGDQLAIAVENAILNGLGPNPGAGKKPQPIGILTGVTWNTSNSLTYASAVGYDDMVDLKAKLRSMYRPGAVWVINTNMEAELSKVKTSTGKPILVTDVANGLTPKILNFPYVVDDYIPDDTIILGRMDYYFMNFSQGATIEMSKDAGFTSASTYYRGILIADGKPALSEAFCKLTKTS